MGRLVLHPLEFGARRFLDVMCMSLKEASHLRLHPLGHSLFPPSPPFPSAAQWMDRAQTPKKGTSTRAAPTLYPQSLDLLRSWYFTIQWLKSPGVWVQAKIMLVVLTVVYDFFIYLFFSVVPVLIKTVLDWNSQPPKHISPPLFPLCFFLANAHIIFVLHRFVCLVEMGPALPLPWVITSVWAAAHYRPAGVKWSRADLLGVH